MARRGARPVYGRESELAAVDEAYGRPQLLVVRGRPGMGKTTLLREVHRTWRTRGTGMVRIHCSAAMPRWDLFGTRAVVKAFRDAFPDIGNSPSADAMAAVNRLCLPESYGSARARSVLFTELVRLFAHLAGRAPRAVLIDDLHTAPDPALLVAAAHRVGCTVVATYREDGWAARPAGAASPYAFADRVVDLGPLPDDRIDALVAAAAREPLDEAVTSALRAALGPLAGNPGTVVDTFAALRRAGRLVRFQGHLCLGDPAAGPALPDGHALVRRVAECGATGRQLLALTSSADRFTLDDLPDFAVATGRDPAACGHTVDRLVAAGALVCDDHGVLRVPCPALVAAVLPGPVREEAAEVHRALAAHLLRGARTPSSDRAVPSDHIVLAGAALPPAPAVVPLLEREAALALGTCPVRAARRYRAALHHCPPGTPARSRILAALLPLLVRTGDHEGLAEVVAVAVAEAGTEAVPEAGAAGACVGGGGPRRAELAAYAALAAVHTGRPVPADVREALAVDSTARRALEFADRWFTGRELFRPSEAAAVFSRLRPDGAGPARTDVAGVTDRADMADAADGYGFDPVALFRRVLGPTVYGEPVTGPLAAYARVAQAYRDGNWAGIPSGARALERAGPPHTPVHHAVRLLAAEVHSTLGDYERSAAWLELAGDDCPFPALRAWAAMGLAYRTGHWAQARKLGWRHCDGPAERADGGGTVGIGRLLVRLSFAEWEDGGRRDLLPRLRTEAERWHSRLGGTELRSAVLITRAFADHDADSAREAVEVLRERGGRSELLRACMTVAFLADDPRPWHQEAHDIARSLGDSLHRTAMPGATGAFGLDPGTCDSTGPESPTALSGLEGRIAVLVGRGLTNRQIAKELQVSEKAVENNLTQVFAKSGCRSRLDLALAVVEGRVTRFSSRS
ncbi:transcriptional regulator, LuxR family [Actinobacteria bacterium OK074]|nr:transcriptional regulator, LuxR family [Actinobacteria bacterium OK074]